MTRRAAPRPAAAPLAAFLLALARPAACDEIAFVDVGAGDAINIRSLDTEIKPLAGIENLFSADPMASHDWANPRAILAAFEANIDAWKAKDSKAAQRLDELQDELAPLYSVLPKNEHGRLDNGTVRYGLHRHFVKKYGWSVKGLEPAGASWVRTLTVDPTVKQITKYIAPAYLQSLAFERTGDGKGLNLQWLTLVAATIRHLAHTEMTEYLYSTMRALEYPISGARQEHEVDEIIAGFLMVYSFGTDLQASARADFLRERRYLDTHHQGWNELRAYVRGLMFTASPPLDDFDSILRFAKDVAGKYGAWQDRDCKLAMTELAAMPGQALGSVPMSSVKPFKHPGRRELFTESEEEMAKLGATEEGADGAVILLAPNYVLSQAMCLTTAGVHTVCCVNECDALLEKVESVAGAPEAAPAVILSALGSDVGGAEELASLAAEGPVRLHSRPFAEWMHRRFPLHCPKPREHSRASPKTPDEWMADPGEDVADTEELMQELAAVLSRYTTQGSGMPMQDSRESDEAASDTGDVGGVRTVITVRPDVDVDATPIKYRRATWLWQRLGCVLQVVAVGSMVGLARTAGSSALIPALRRAAGRDGDGLKKEDGEVTWVLPGGAII